MIDQCRVIVALTVGEQHIGSTINVYWTYTSPQAKFEDREKLKFNNLNMWTTSRNECKLHRELFRSRYLVMISIKGQSLFVWNEIQANIHAQKFGWSQVQTTDMVRSGIALRLYTNNVECILSTVFCNPCTGALKYYNSVTRIILYQWRISAGECFMSSWSALSVIVNDKFCSQPIRCNDFSS